MLPDHVFECTAGPSNCSAGAGQGSEFVLRLPVAPGTDTAAVSPRADPVGSYNPLQFLIVDDNHDSADMLATWLQFAGHETFAAHDGCRPPKVHD